MDTRSWTGRAGVTLAAMIALSCAALSTPAFAADLPAAKMVGKETCATCHAEMTEKFDKTFHGRKSLSNKVLLHSCETCHGPGGDHAETGDISKIINPKKLSVAAGNDACLSCHKDGSLMLWKTSSHANSDMSCMSCHSVHESVDRKSLTRDGTDSCMTCHKKQAADMKLASHHPVLEGKMTCVSCHNPHGGIDGNLKADSVIESCATCHSEKVGPFANEHPPVSDSCTNCHVVHGSANDRLLKLPVQTLCMSCHRKEHTNFTTTGTTQMVFAQRERCTDCHREIHGSDRAPAFRK